jgi:hypothetical protein
MNRPSTLLLIILISVSAQLFAQQKHSISGYVREKDSRELLPGVNITFLSSGRVQPPIIMDFIQLRFLRVNMN